MMKELSDKKANKKWKSYITGIITSNFTSFNKIDKYFRYDITESSSKAIQENWTRILGIDFEIISMNLCKENRPLGIALEGRNEIDRDTQEVIQHHFFKIILPTFCIGLTGKFMLKDEILEVNGLKVLGLTSKEILHTLKKASNYFQIVVARSIHHNYDLASDYGGSEDNINSPISFYDVDDDESSRNGTLRSMASNYSSTSRDFGSSVSFTGLIDGHESVTDYLRNMIGWRGPIVIELRKEKTPFGIALEEIRNPLQPNSIIVFKYIVRTMSAGKDGRLHAGDRLLQVNGKSLEGVPYRQVCKWIKSAPRGRLVLYVCKPHFAATSYDHRNLENDNYYFNTLRDMNKLPKLIEETDNEFQSVSPIPEYIEAHITLKKKESKLGIILDIVDEGKNGARIKKMTHGIAKDDGRLCEGDFITKINDTSLKVNEKQKLDFCLKQIAADTRDYNISYITAEDIRLHKCKYSTIASQEKVVQPNNPEFSIYSNSKFNRGIETINECDSNKVKNPKLSFETFNIIINNDHKTRLGLVLAPSLKDPNRFISITEIHDDSLCGKSGLLKVNDEILMVNNVSFENMTVKDAGQILIADLKLKSDLNFQVRRLTCSDNLIVKPLIEHLTQFPDIYHCNLRKGPNGYGFSLLELESNNGVIVDNLDLYGLASKVSNLKPGQRFAMINKRNVISCSKLDIVQIVKNSSRNLELIMEIPKYREFNVKICKDSSMSLGLNVAGGCDTKIPIPIIESLVPNRTSKFSEDLSPYDLIVELDGKNITQQKHNDVIQILRSTGPEINFKILRKIPYFKREIFANIELPDFPHSYLQDIQYTITLKKSIFSTYTISSFGINFTDVVIVDENNYFQVLGRYKAVLSIEKNSYAEKYASQIKLYDFLVSIDGILVNDYHLLCEDLKETIDKNNCVNLVFSKDIPYKIDLSKDHDSPFLLCRSNIVSQSESSSEENLSQHSNSQPGYIVTPDHVVEDTINVKIAVEKEYNTTNETTNDIETPDVETPDVETPDVETPEVEKLIDPEGENNVMTEIMNSIDKGNIIPEIVEKDHNVNDYIEKVNFQNDDVSVEKTLDKAAIIPEKVETDHNVNECIEEVNFQNDDVSVEETLDNSIVDKTNDKIETHTPENKSNDILELGINISNVIINRIPNNELGFQLYGGLNGGPNGESLPVFVIGVEKNTCNWPGDREEPFLKNGQQLIEFNNQVISALKLSSIEVLIKETEFELNFKVVSFK